MNDAYHVHYIASDGSIYRNGIIDHSYGYSYIIRVRFTARIISVLYMKGAIKYEKVIRS